MKLFIYIFPALINFVTAGVFYYVTQRFVDAGASKFLTGLTLPVWAASYCLVNIIIGRIVKSSNAVRLIVAGGVVISGASLGFLLVTALNWQLIWTGLFGVGFGFYCTPFQLWCKDVEQSDNGTVAAAAGMYTAAWSIGFAAGFAAFGLLKAQTAFALCFAVGLFEAAGVLLINRFRKAPSQMQSEAAVSRMDGENLPDLAWIGWIVGGVGTFSISQLRSMLQVHGAQLEIANAHAQLALVLMLVSLVQGVAALFLARSGKFMYRVWPGIVYGFCGVISMLIICFAVTVPWFYLAAVIYGIYSGCFYFCFVLYSLNHPTRAGRNAAVNEVVVALTSFFGPMLGGLLVDYSRASWVPFALAGGCTLLAMVFQAVAMNKKERI